MTRRSLLRRLVGGAAGLVAGKAVASAGPEKVAGVDVVGLTTWTAGMERGAPRRLMDPGRQFWFYPIRATEFFAESV